MKPDEKYERKSFWKKKKKKDEEKPARKTKKSAKGGKERPQPKLSIPGKKGK
jgi:hypothetical protein